MGWHLLLGKYICLSWVAFARLWQLISVNAMKKFLGSCIRLRFSAWYLCRDPAKEHLSSNTFSYMAATAVLLVLLVLSHCILGWANAHWSVQSAGSKARCQPEGLHAKVCSHWYSFSWRACTFSNVNSTKTSGNGSGDIIWNLMDCLQLLSFRVTVQSHTVMGIYFVRSCLGYKRINGRGRFALS